MGCSNSLRAKGAWRQAALVLAAAGLLGGCGTTGGRDVPATVEDRTALQRPAGAPVAATGRPAGEPAAARARGPEAVPQAPPQVAAYTPPATPRHARPEPTRAAGVLMRRAEDQAGAGDLGGAVASLERALRIAPDDPLLWQRLAEVRMAQRRPDLVAQLAAKSNALAAPADQALRARNWQLIAEARRALGDEPGARAAERQANANR